MLVVVFTWRKSVWSWIKNKSFSKKKNIKININFEYGAILNININLAIITNNKLEKTYEVKQDIAIDCL